MNKEQRKVLDKLKEELGVIIGKLDDIKSEIDAVKDEEQEKYDNMPESFQSGEKGEKVESGITYLDEVSGNLDEAIETLGSAVDSIESSQE